MRYEDLISERAPAWPYPVSYGKETEVGCDVLVLGGGIAGCWAAIGAARKGAKVVMVEKGVTETSGAGGSGVDHWHAARTNPASKVTPEEFAQAVIEENNGWRSGISQYITCRESYDCLLGLEKLGGKVRDSEDGFKGADFRGEGSKLLFAYDYNARYCIRLWGANVKPALYRECQRLGGTLFNHAMVPSLLNEGGEQGARGGGATAVNTRTGEYYVFRGQASILCMFLPQREWIFSTELKGLYTSHRPHTSTGDGHAMAWRAGAQLAGLERSRRAGGGPHGYPQYGVANTANTWYACTLVDANGKEIPWVDRDGRILETVAERYQPAPGQEFFISDMSRNYKYKGPTLIPDWRERVQNGEVAPPPSPAHTAATGRDAGRKAAAYALSAREAAVDRRQVEAEKTRVYAPVAVQGGIHWKELNAGACRIMQDYCGELKSEELLQIGLKWFDELEAGEAATAYARNPHELARLLEVFNIITNGRMILEACRARKASNPFLGFTRSDYPEIDPPEWNKWVTIRLNDGSVKAGELPLDYYGDLKTSYEAP